MSTYFIFCIVIDDGVKIKIMHHWSIMVIINVNIICSFLQRLDCIKKLVASCPFVLLLCLGAGEGNDVENIIKKALPTALLHNKNESFIAPPYFTLGNGVMPF